VFASTDFVTSWLRTDSISSAAQWSMESAEREELGGALLPTGRRILIPYKKCGHSRRSSRPSSRLLLLIGPVSEISHRRHHSKVLKSIPATEDVRKVAPGERREVRPARLQSGNERRWPPVDENPLAGFAA